jgi:hypothetical protein
MEKRKEAIDTTRAIPKHLSTLDLLTVIEVHLLDPILSHDFDKYLEYRD